MVPTFGEMAFVRHKTAKQSLTRHGQGSIGRVDLHLGEFIADAPGAMMMLFMASQQLIDSRVPYLK
jgi:hypothetical protein